MKIKCPLISASLAEVLPWNLLLKPRVEFAVKNAVKFLVKFCRSSFLRKQSSKVPRIFHDEFHAIFHQTLCSCKSPISWHFSLCRRLSECPPQNPAQQEILNPPPPAAPPYRHPPGAIPHNPMPPLRIPPPSIFQLRPTPRPPPQKPLPFLPSPNT